MKKLFLSTIFSFLLFTAFAVKDTLRHYDPTATLVSFGASVEQAARFDLQAPGNIVEILVMLSGDSGGTAQLHIYGHEGGSYYPHFEKDLITPITITKTTDTVEQISTLIQPGVFLANNVFFVSLSNLSSGVKVMGDNVVKDPFCSSGTGGDYYFQYTKSGSSWTSGDYAYAVDVIMEVDTVNSPKYFQEVTHALGVDTLLTAKRIAAADYDEDGDVDLLINSRLYRNDINTSGVFVNIMDSIGLIGSAIANAFVDMNNDGLMDIFLFDYANRDSSYLYTNNGDGTFSEEFMSDIPAAAQQGMSCFSFADVNNDNYPDLFMGQLWKTYPTPHPNYLFYNDQNNGFTNESSKLMAGSRRGRGSAWVDFDDDGDLDLYVTNYYLEKDEFYQNNGNGASFTNIISQKGIDVNNGTYGANHGTGVDWWDYDNDGDMDLLLPALAHPDFMEQDDHRGTTIFQNDGPPNYSFTDTQGSNGIEYEETHASGLFGDLNNDGLSDFFLATFYGCRFVDIHMQKADHTFELKTWEYGIETIATEQDGIFVDIDNDGRLDLIAGKDKRIRIFKNEGPTANYVKVRLKSTTKNKWAIGARVKVYAGGETYMQEVTAGRGLNMQRPYTMHYGVANATVDSVAVRWPGDTDYEVFTNITTNDLNVLTEGTGPTALKEQKKGDWDLISYPNPSQEAFTINYRLNALPAGSYLELLDLYGRSLQQIDLVNPTGNISLGADLAAGVYFVQIVAEGAQKNPLRIVKY